MVNLCIDTSRVKWSQSVELENIKLAWRVGYFPSGSELGGVSEHAGACPLHVSVTCLDCLAIKRVIESSPSKTTRWLGV